MLGLVKENMIQRVLDEKHMPNTLWTIKVETNGMTFYISHMVFQDIAQSAAKGIRADNPGATVTVFFAQDTTQNEGQ